MARNSMACTIEFMDSQKADAYKKAVDWVLDHEGQIKVLSFKLEWRENPIVSAQTARWVIRIHYHLINEIVE